MDTGLILTILAERIGADAALSHAAVAAMALSEPTICALHVRVDPFSTIMPTEEILSKKQEERLLREGEAEGAALKLIYEAWVKRLPTGLVADWEDLAGTEVAQIGQHAKEAALLVMAAPTAATRGHALQAFHAALFDVHRPVLAVPPDHQAAPIQRILIGWKEGEVSRRAIKAALPWLRQAADVQVVSIGEPDDGELGAADQFMASLGIHATARTVAENRLSDGERLLAEAQAVQADWLVMGAYRRNRLVEWVLGGITRTVMDQAQLPVFMKH
jgi:nucleotide-binding universal stress UspA family protein